MGRGRERWLNGLALSGLVLVASPAVAQDLVDRALQPPADGAGAAAPQGAEEITFSATQLDYDQDADIVTATGDVRMLRSGSRLRADTVTWNRKTGEVSASGGVAIVNPGGDTSYADRVQLSDDLKTGIADNLLLVLENGGRVAAAKSTRNGDRYVLDHAAYTPCRVADDDDCPKRPSWQITALRVTYDRQRHRIFYRDARFRLFGLTVLALPRLSHPDGSGTGGGGSGLLLPSAQISRRNGLEIDLPYYWQLAPNRDITITPRLYSKVLPALDTTYRYLGSTGAFQVRGMATYGSRLPATFDASDKNRGIRAFVDATGRWQFGPNWTLSAIARRETDRTFMKRYDISDDDRLRSNLQLERIDQDSYLSVAGWLVQDLRATRPQGQQPIALPEIDYRRRFADPWLGGTFQLQLNTLALTRTSGQDTQRAFAGLRWDLSRVTRWGQQVTLTGFSRADIYHTDEVGKTPTLLYQGEPGFRGRGIVAAAVDVRWPFAGTLFGGTQVLSPRVQAVAEPGLRNLPLPNEDSRAIDLEDANLFALNRFPGYDRWEDASRVTYGVEWSYTRPRLQVDANFGQSYRLSNVPDILPPGTGLSDRSSDFVGRVNVRYGRFLQFTERFRLDKDNLAVRRNEVDAVIGSQSTYALIGYLRLKRDIDTNIEDLRDRSELRLGGRVQFARYWSIFGSAIIDLTTREDDPTSITDGFAQVRDRLGVQYENECLALAVTWRRDRDPTGDARRGNTFALRLALKNLGR